jgi:high affinity sulfate transporter 1
VLDGFIIGLAFTIAIGQAGKLVGVSTTGDTGLQKTISIFSQAAKWDWLPFVLGAFCLVLLFTFGHYLPRVPAAIIAVVITTLAAYLLNLGAHGLKIVGEIPGGLPAWGLKGLGLEDLYHILPGALAVALVGFTESIAVAKDDAVRHDYEIDANQEMIANGMSNVGSGLFQGFAVNGSLSKSAANEAAGGNTQVSTTVTALLTLATILFLTGLFKYLPEATLGAIVVHALWKYFNPAGLVRLYRVRKGDFVLAIAALVGVILFGVLPGIVIGIVLSLALLIQRASSPNSAVLGMKPDGTRFADITNNPGYKTIPGLLIYRFDAPLVFPNAERFITEVRTLVKALEPPVKTVIIDFEVVSDMDTTASDQFVDLLSLLEKGDVGVMLARVHAPVRAFMEKDGLVDKIGEENFYPRVMDAVQAFQGEGSTGGD